MSDFIPINLPSGCLVYPEVDPADIKVRAYQGRDEVYLAQINPVNLERNYFEVLKEVIQGVDPLQLTLGDRLYIIIWECINSYTDTIKVKTVCSHCMKDVEVSVDLRTLNSVSLPEDFKQPYPVTLPVSGEEVQLRLLTVEDDIAVEKYGKKNDDTMLYRFARSLVTEDDIVTTLKKFESMHAKDLIKIMGFHENFFHGPEMESSFDCPDCGEEDDVDVPFLTELFFQYGSRIKETFGEGI